MEEEALTIGVFINDQLNPNLGGGYTYNHRLIRELKKYNFSEKIIFKFVRIINHKSSLKEVRKENFINLQPPNSVKYKLYHFASKMKRFLPLFRRLSNKSLRKMQHMRQNHYITQLINNKIHLIYYLTPEVSISNYPFIINNWDLGHRTLYPFPEVAMNKTYETRETFYRDLINKAFLIFVESEQGKRELIHYYQINEEKIKVFPMFPGEVIFQTVSQEKMQNILDAFFLEKHQYFFYPAQFWAHKNHYNLIKAFSLIHKKYPKLKLALTGADKGNLMYIQDYIKSKGLTQSVQYLGFVSNEELYTLYINSIALVMPTFLGPTNMPLLEADSLGVKILCSDLIGHIELLGSKATYFSPKIPESIFQAMEQAIEKKESLNDAYEYKVRLDLLNEYLSELKSIRNTFGFNFSQY